MRLRRLNPADSVMTKSGRKGAMTVVLALALMGSAAPVFAQNAPTFANTNGSKDMMVNAGAITYDSKSQIVTLTSKVQIFYQGRSLEADRVTYNKKTKHIHAIGNVRQVEPNGNIAFAKELEFDENFSNGFAKVLNLETPDRLRIAGAYVTRESAETTTIHKGVYTACEPCQDHPERSPAWQVKAEKIVHKESEHRLYFDDAYFEVLGVPVAWVPFFSVPDSTVRKASGFMAPTVTVSDRLGFGAEMSYFWNIAPDYDLTIGLGGYSKQGALPRLEWRQGFETGSYTVRGAGIFQRDGSAFAGEPGQRDFRGYINTEGKFNVAKGWVLGWNIYGFTDQTFMRDYNFLPSGSSEANSTVYLQGSKLTSFFEARVTKYQGATLSDNNNRMPFTSPAIDYFKVLPEPVLGGELSWKVNSVTMTRLEADFANRNTTDCSITANMSRANCMMLGIQGSYSRVSAEVNWRKRLTDSLGQVWEPYLGLRGDLAGYTTTTPLQAVNYTGNDTQGVARAMPTLGLNYRYPWLARHSWGTSVFEPIAQVVVRPNETSIGNLPNEDSQSLVFDDTNLFAWNKFSGYDRVEGGGRVNYALQYTAQADSGQRASILIGQSQQLFGLNSFTSGNLDMVNAGLNSGLDKTASDYISRIALQPTAKTRFNMRGRFDQADLSLQRGEAEATTQFDRAAFTAFASYFAPQPLLGYYVPRSGFGGALSYRFADYWTAFGSMRYAFTRPAATGSTTSITNSLDGYSVGLSYLDDCNQFSFFYSRDMQGVGLADIQRYMFRFNLRTFGDYSVASGG